MAIMTSTLPHGELHDLTRARILVVGDLILDHYVRGITERTSPEAPVPVVLFRGEDRIPGGAANVARNIVAAGAVTMCVGAIGEDQDGDELLACLGRLGIDGSGIVRLRERPTTLKTRILSHNQQMLRLDREDSSPLPLDVQEQIIESCLQLLPGCNAVIVSDYAKGVLTPLVLENVIGEARNRGIPLFVDPKARDFSRYRGAYALTPNAKEAFEATGCPTTAEEGLSRAAEAIMGVTQCEAVAITRGGEGLGLFLRGESAILVPAAAREVYDVTGAGDTFVAFLAMGVAAGFRLPDAARLANAAAGIVVGKIGAATVSLFELRAALSTDAVARKLREPDDLSAIGDSLRSSGKRIVFTNGCFDFLHAGHVNFLQEARALGDVLILGMNTDRMIARLKGDPRPILKQAQREKLLAAIQAVDFIVPFDEETPHQLIRDLRPDVLVKGSNYDTQQVEGHEIVDSYGGRVVLLPVLEDISTQDLVARRKNQA
jgi:D-beta-D-heptose 7-phosphate kinase / D-beta-D-heptose 1-phosphate adenosyltransferase